MAKRPADSKSPSHDPLVGRDLGPYSVLEVIGRGGFAVVYRARHHQLNRDVALKVLREGDDGMAPERVEEFLHEARAAARFNHPNLIQVYDVGEADGRHFLAMELVAGGSLAAELKLEGPLEWGDALPIIRDITAALQCAHEHQMVHCDVHPANVLLTDDGRAKLGDLGLAGGHRLAGTPAFMAPEQALRRPVDGRTDLYGLGCTIFATLTGAPPFERDSTKATLLAQAREAPPALASRGAIVPRAVEDFVERLLAKKPEDRPQSAAEVLTELDSIGEHGGRALRSQRVRARRSRPASSSAALVVGAIVVVVAVAGALVAWKYLG